MKPKTCAVRFVSPREFERLVKEWFKNAGKEPGPVPVNRVRWPGGTIKRKLKRVLAISTAATVLCCVLPPTAYAMTVRTDQTIGQFAADQDRARIHSLLDRADIREKLQIMGVDARAVKQRVAGLTDSEAHDMARELDTLPAGGSLGSNDLIVVLLVVILVVLLI
jgi:hypothetical protein